MGSGPADTRYEDPAIDSGFQAQASTIFGAQEVQGTVLCTQQLPSGRHRRLRKAGSCRTVVQCRRSEDPRSKA
ncbi:hypothetical protein ACHAWF_000778 [Thalassiosira exigua]